ncbi:MAG TPA: tripartite tricarboxylate transporter substrate binding protein, partial [Burkholderiales bacterium]|nr:tripartite tricarboxylate transporter substrate binding protein [Burkholderiales bacterium]
MKIKTRQWLSAAHIAVAFTAAISGAAHAQTYPARPPKLVIPFFVGGISDFIGRVVAEAVKEPLGSSMQVENRPGAGGNIGMDYVAKSSPDGYVIGLATVGLASNSVLQPKTPFDPLKDFTPIVMVGSIPSVIVVHPSLPVKSMKDFIELARRHPDELAFGSSGMGTGSHLAVELFKSATHTRMLHVPYKGTAQAVPDLLSGRIQFMFDFPTTAIEPIKQGKLRGLAVTSAQRSPALPDLPTTSEAGLKGYEFGTWAGILAPAGLPPIVAEKLAASFMKALQSPMIKTRFAEQAIDVSVKPPQEF